MQEYKVTVDDGTIRYYKPGTNELHRLDGPAIEWANGTKLWYQHNERHRTDGPAVEWAGGNKHWWQNGNRHRIDGPAIERVDGTVEYWIDGKQLTPAQFKKKTAPKAKEMIIAEIEALLGHTVKVVK